MLVTNIKIWKSHLNIREGSDYGEGCFEHPGQMLKWMILKVSPILYAFIDLCDI